MESISDSHSWLEGLGRAGDIHQDQGHLAPGQVVWMSPLSFHPRGESFILRLLTTHPMNKAASAKRWLQIVVHRFAGEKTLTKSKGVLFRPLYPLTHPSQQLVNCTSRASQKHFTGRTPFLSQGNSPMWWETTWDCYLLSYKLITLRFLTSFPELFLVHIAKVKFEFSGYFLFKCY